MVSSRTNNNLAKLNTMVVIKNTTKAKATLSFFDWAYKNGDEAAKQLDYVPLPEATKGLIRDSWKQVVGADGKAVF